jgi:hypothetical protein
MNRIDLTAIADTSRPEGKEKNVTKFVIDAHAMMASAGRENDQKEDLIGS